MIECLTLYGKKKFVPAAKLKFRPAAYGIVINKDKILLISLRNTKKYFFPGGGVNFGETLETAALREVKEETGIKVKIVRLIFFKESYFYYDPLDEAFQSYSFFYLCKPLTLSLSEDFKVKDEEAEKPRWVKIKSLHKKDFQGFGWEVFERYLSYKNNKIKF